ncbi:MAG: SPOR domain-containing protein [Bacteroidales bacterium]|nr:SPOR domain-containing protein [Bacteroidales bacterium]
MKVITAYIEYLLTENDCVIVPGFGGFVIQPIASQFIENVVTAPSQEICFNAGLLHDDGLLLTTISKVAGVSYNDARRLVQNDLELFSSELSYKSRVNFGKVGIFSFDESQNLVFDSLTGTNIHNFGFSTVKLLKLSELEKREEAIVVSEEKNNDIIQIRFSKRKALRAVASVAAVFLLWIISTPVSDVSRKMDAASIINQTELLKSIQLSTVVADSTIKKDSVTANIESKNIADAPVSVVAATTSTEDKYFVVLGSFQSEKSANRHLDQLTTAGIQQVKVEKLGTLMRTTLRSFSDKAAAEKYLHSIRYDRQEFNEAWLYCKK